MNHSVKLTRDINLPPATPPPKDFSVDFLSGIDFLGIWQFLQRRVKIIAWCAALFFVIGLSAILQIPREYTAEALVIVELRKPTSEGQVPMPGMHSVDMAVIRTEVEVLRSPMIAAGVVDKLDLTHHPEFNSALRAPSLGTKFSNGLSSLVGLDSQGATANLEEQQVLQRTIKSVMDKTIVVNDGRSYVLKIRATSQSPDLAANLANAYADVYFLSQLQSKFESVRRSNSWLDDNLSEMRGKVEASANAVQEFMAENGLDQTIGNTILDQQTAELSTQLVLASTSRAQKQANLDQLRRAMKTGDIAAVTPVLSSPLIQEMRRQETDLVREGAQLAVKYKPEHPALINIAAQTRDLRQKISEEISKIVSSFESEVESALTNERILRDSLSNIQATVAMRSKTWPRMQELQRQANADQALYENFLNIFRQASANEYFEQSDVRLLSPAAVPLAPSYPRRTFLAALALVGAVFFSLLLAVVIERFDPGFRSPENVEKYTGLRALGMIPEIKESESVASFIAREPGSRFAEALRTVRTALQYTNVDTPSKVVLVTSAAPEEGKSLFALSLGLSIAESKRKVLLIECDLRRPSIAKKLRLSPTVALPALLRGKMAKVDNGIYVEEVTGLHVMPATAGTTNPQDVLGSEQMQNMIEKMRSKYDTIILDSPPTLAASDSIVLSHMADSMLFLVRWGHTPHHAVVDAIKLLHEQAGVVLAGVVLSRVDDKHYTKYGYGSKDYYAGYYGKAEPAKA